MKLMRNYLSHTVLPLAALLLAIAGGAVKGDDARAGSAADALAAHLAFMKDIRAIETRFACEKRLEALESQLVSFGVIWIGRPDSVRFSTQKPYLSELILHDGKVLTRNQHEPKWSRANQSSRPGLAAVMGQLAAWSIGETASIARFYQVSEAAGEVPAGPAGPDQPRTDAAPAKVEPVDLYLLKPVDKAVAEVIRGIQLGIGRESHALQYVLIITAQGDETRYWFRDVRLNADLPPRVFAPEDAK